MKIILNDFEIRNLIRNEISKKLKKNSIDDIIQSHEITIKENELSDELEIFAEYILKEF